MVRKSKVRLLSVRAHTLALQGGSKGCFPLTLNHQEGGRHLGGDSPPVVGKSNLRESFTALTARQGFTGEKLKREEPCWQRAGCALAHSLPLVH